MAINKYTPHIIVIPEDEANRQIALGFTLGCQTRQIRIDNVGRGWTRTLDLFNEEYSAQMRALQGRCIDLLIDFDGQHDRISIIKQQLPADIANRVFVLGCFNEPENLKADFGSYEKIGTAIATECINRENTIWQSKHLIHNVDELERLKTLACGLFRS